MKRALRLALAILAVMAFSFAAGQVAEAPGEAGPAARDALGMPVAAPPAGLLSSGAGFGLLLLGSWFVGKLMKTVGLPKISGYLLFGLIVGPSALGLVTKEQIPYLRLANDLAMAIIALTAGGEIHLPFLRKSLRTVVAVCVLAIVFVVVGVGGGLLALMGPLGIAKPEGLLDAGLLALALAVVAAAGSPAVVVAVISEVRAVGTLTQTALAVVVSRDLFVIVLFPMVIALVSAISGEGGGEGSAADATGALLDLPADLAWQIGGSLAAGAIIGVGLAWYMRTIHAHLPIFVVLTCFGIAIASEALGLEPLIVALVAGLLMRNVWPEAGAPLFDTIAELNTPVYCVFFAVAGAKLDLAAFVSIWPAVLLFALLRAGLLWAAAATAMRMVKVEGSARQWLWTALVPQAGIALLLASIMQKTLEGRPDADSVFAFLVGMIALIELVSPLIFKIGLMRAGEAGGGAEQGAGRE